MARLEPGSCEMVGMAIIKINIMIIIIKMITGMQNASG